MYAVLSGAYYGATVWSERALASRRIQQNLRKVQRRLALRIARAYRTVSSDALALLTGIPPAERLADALAESYARVEAIRFRGVVVAPGDATHIRDEARRWVFREWRDSLLRNPPTRAARSPTSAPHNHRVAGRGGRCPTSAPDKVRKAHAPGIVVQSVTGWDSVGS